MLHKHSLFRQINIDFQDLDFAELQGQQRTNYGGVFKEYNAPTLDLLTDLLKDRVKFHCRPDLINITEIHSPGVAPHVDQWTTALNFYFDAQGGDSTVFYHEPKEHIKYRGTSYKAFDRQDLKFDRSFIVLKGQCWLLNTSIPHSVVVRQQKTKRSMLRLAWYKGSFEEIYSSIELL
jgi:hypothetical protein